MFDPRSPYSRRMWHYESDRPLSVAQLIALGSVDARTAALLWLLIERHHSLIVSGPTDPTPGIGKTTTLNALLDFLRGGSTLVYTTGMYEDFSFRDAVDPATTCVLANEVSDHLRIYMWGRVARELLTLPQEGFAVATSCHADTMDNVLDLLLRDLRLPPAAVAQLGIVINIGMVGRVWPPRRRFLTINLLRPAETPDTPASVPLATNPGQRRSAVRLLSLAEWDAKTDTHRPASAETLAEIAVMLAMTPATLDAALARRRACLEQLAAGQGTGRRALRTSVEELQDAERIREGSDEADGEEADADETGAPTAQNEQTG